MGGAMHVDPVFGEALQPRDAMAYFVVENLRTASRNGIKPGFAQSHYGVANRETAVLRNRDNLGSGKTVKMNFWEAVFDSPQQTFEPVDLQIRMQTALHQHACSADLDRFSNFFVNRFEIEDVPFRSQFALERTIESAKRTIFRAEVRVINIAIDDVGDYTFRMQLAPNGIGLHADAD